MCGRRGSGRDSGHPSPHFPRGFHYLCSVLHTQREKENGLRPLPCYLSSETPPPTFVVARLWLEVPMLILSQLLKTLWWVDRNVSPMLFSAHQLHVCFLFIFFWSHCVCILLLAFLFLLFVCVFVVRLVACLFFCLLFFLVTLCLYSTLGFSVLAVCLCVWCSFGCLFVSVFVYLLLFFLALSPRPLMRAKSGCRLAELAGISLVRLLCLALSLPSSKSTFSIPFKEKLVL